MGGSELDQDLKLASRGAADIACGLTPSQPWGEFDAGRGWTSLTWAAGMKKPDWRCEQASRFKSWGRFVEPLSVELK